MGWGRGLFDRVIPDLRGRITGFILEYLGRYLEGLDRKNVKLKLWQGDLIIQDVKLRADAFDSLFQKAGDLPWALVGGRVERLHLKVPWSNLKRESVVVTMSGVTGLVVPQKGKRWGRDAAELVEKMAALAKWEAARLTGGLAAEMGQASPKAGDAPPAPGGGGWIDRLKSLIVENLRFVIEDVHMRYEDCVTRPYAPFAVGVQLASIGMAATNQAREEVFVVNPEEKTMSKTLHFNNFQLYVVPHLDLPQALAGPQFETTKNVYVKQVAVAEEDLVLHPLSCVIHIDAQRDLGAGGLDTTRPSVVSSVSITTLHMAASRAQYLALLQVAQVATEHPAPRDVLVARPAPFCRPCLSSDAGVAAGRAQLGYTADARGWWRYAIAAVIAQSPRSQTRRARQRSAPPHTEEEVTRYSSLYKTVTATDKALGAAEAAEYEALERALPLEVLLSARMAATVGESKKARSFFGLGHWRRTEKPKGAAAADEPESLENSLSSAPPSPRAADPICEEEEPLPATYAPGRCMWSLAVQIAGVGVILRDPAVAGAAGAVSELRLVLLDMSASLHARPEGVTVAGSIKSLDVIAPARAAFGRVLIGTPAAVAASGRAHAASAFPHCGAASFTSSAEGSFARGGGQAAAPGLPAPGAVVEAHGLKTEKYRAVNGQQGRVLWHKTMGTGEEDVVLVVEFPKPAGRILLRPGNAKVVSPSPERGARGGATPVLTTLSFGTVPPPAHASHGGRPLFEMKYEQRPPGREGVDAAVSATLLPLAFVVDAAALAFATAFFAVPAGGDRAVQRSLQRISEEAQAGIELAKAHADAPPTPARPRIAVSLDATAPILILSSRLSSDVPAGRCETVAQTYRRENPEASMRLASTESMGAPPEVLLVSCGRLVVTDRAAAAEDEAAPRQAFALRLDSVYIDLHTLAGYVAAAPPAARLLQPVAVGGEVAVKSNGDRDVWCRCEALAMRLSLADLAFVAGVLQPIRALGGAAPAAAPASPEEDAAAGNPHGPADGDAPGASNLNLLLTLESVVVRFDDEVLPTALSAQGTAVSIESAASGETKVTIDTSDVHARVVGAPDMGGDAAPQHHMHFLQTMRTRGVDGAAEADDSGSPLVITVVSPARSDEPVAVDVSLDGLVCAVGEPLVRTVEFIAKAVYELVLESEARREKSLKAYQMRTAAAHEAGDHDPRGDPELHLTIRLNRATIHALERAADRFLVEAEGACVGVTLYPIGVGVDISIAAAELRDLEQPAEVNTMLQVRDHPLVVRIQTPGPLGPAGGGVVSGLHIEIEATGPYVTFFFEQFLQLIAYFKVGWVERLIDLSDLYDPLPPPVTAPPVCSIRIRDVKGTLPPHVASGTAIHALVEMVEVTTSLFMDTPSELWFRVGIQLTGAEAWDATRGRRMLAPTSLGLRVEDVVQIDHRPVKLENFRLSLEAEQVALALTMEDYALLMNVVFFNFLGTPPPDTKADEQEAQVIDLWFGAVRIELDGAVAIEATSLRPKITRDRCGNRTISVPLGTLTVRELPTGRAMLRCTPAQVSQEEPPCRPPPDVEEVPVATPPALRPRRRMRVSNPAVAIPRTPPAESLPVPPVHDGPGFAQVDVTIEGVQRKVRVRLETCRFTALSDRWLHLSRVLLNEESLAAVSSASDAMVEKSAEMLREAAQAEGGSADVDVRLKSLAVVLVGAAAPHAEILEAAATGLQVGVEMTHAQTGVKVTLDAMTAVDLTGLHPFSALNTVLQSTTDGSPLLKVALTEYHRQNAPGSYVPADLRALFAHRYTLALEVGPLRIVYRKVLWELVVASAVDGPMAAAAKLGLASAKDATEHTISKANLAKVTLRWAGPEVLLPINAARGGALPYARDASGQSAFMLSRSVLSSNTMSRVMSVGSGMSQTASVIPAAAAHPPMADDHLLVALVDVCISNRVAVDVDPATEDTTVWDHITAAVEAVQVRHVMHHRSDLLLDAVGAGCVARRCVGVLDGGALAPDAVATTTVTVTLPPIAARVTPAAFCFCTAFAETNLNEPTEPAAQTTYVDPETPASTPSPVHTVRRSMFSRSSLCLSSDSGGGDDEPVLDQEALLERLHELLAVGGAESPAFPGSPPSAVPTAEQLALPRPLDPWGAPHVGRTPTGVAAQLSAATFELECPAARLFVEDHDGTELVEAAAAEVQLTAKTAAAGPGAPKVALFGARIATLRVTDVQQAKVILCPQEDRAGDPCFSTRVAVEESGAPPRKRRRRSRVPAHAFSRTRAEVVLTAMQARVLPVALNTLLQTWVHAVAEHAPAKPGVRRSRSSADIQARTARILSPTEKDSTGFSVSVLDEDDVTYACDDSLCDYSEDGDGGAAFRYEESQLGATLRGGLSFAPGHSTAVAAAASEATLSVRVLRVGATVVDDNDPEAVPLADLSLGQSRIEVESTPSGITITGRLGNVEVVDAATGWEVCGLADPGAGGIASFTATSLPEGSGPHTHAVHVVLNSVRVAAVPSFLLRCKGLVTAAPHVADAVGSTKDRLSGEAKAVVTTAAIRTSLEVHHPVLFIPENPPPVTYPDRGDAAGTASTRHLSEPGIIIDLGALTVHTGAGTDGEDSLEGTMTEAMVRCGVAARDGTQAIRWHNLLAQPLHVEIAGARVPHDVRRDVIARISLGLKVSAVQVVLSEAVWGAVVTVAAELAKLAAAGEPRDAAPPRKRSTRSASEPTGVRRTSSRSAGAAPLPPPPPTEVHVSLLCNSVRIRAASDALSVEVATGELSLAAANTGAAAFAVADVAATAGGGGVPHVELLFAPTVSVKKKTCPAEGPASGDDVEQVDATLNASVSFVPHVWLALQRFFAVPVQRVLLGLSAYGDAVTADAVTEVRHTMTEDVTYGSSRVLVAPAGATLRTVDGDGCTVTLMKISDPLAEYRRPVHIEDGVTLRFEDCVFELCTADPPPSKPVALKTALAAYVSFGGPRAGLVAEAGKNRLVYRQVQSKGEASMAGARPPPAVLRQGSFGGSSAATPEALALAPRPSFWNHVAEKQGPAGVGRESSDGVLRAGVADESVETPTGAGAVPRPSKEKKAGRSKVVLYRVDVALRGRLRSDRAELGSLLLELDGGLECNRRCGPDGAPLQTLGTVQGRRLVLLREDGSATLMERCRFDCFLRSGAGGVAGAEVMVSELAVTLAHSDIILLLAAAAAFAPAARAGQHTLSPKRKRRGGDAAATSPAYPQSTPHTNGPDDEPADDLPVHIDVRVPKVSLCVVDDSVGDVNLPLIDARVEDFAVAGSTQLLRVSGQLLANHYNRGTGGWERLVERSLIGVQVAHQPQERVRRVAITSPTGIEVVMAPSTVACLAHLQSLADGLHGHPASDASGLSPSNASALQAGRRAADVHHRYPTRVENTLPDRLLYSFGGHADNQGVALEALQSVTVLAPGSISIAHAHAAPQPIDTSQLGLKPLRGGIFADVRLEEGVKVVVVKTLMTVRNGLKRPIVVDSLGVLPVGASVSVPEALVDIKLRIGVFPAAPAEGTTEEAEYAIPSLPFSELLHSCVRRGGWLEVPCVTPGTERYFVLSVSRDAANRVEMFVCPSFSLTNYTGATVCMQFYLHPTGEPIATETVETGASAHLMDVDPTQSLYADMRVIQPGGEVLSLNDLPPCCIRHAKPSAAEQLKHREAAERRVITAKLTGLSKTVTPVYMDTTYPSSDREAHLTARFWLVNHTQHDLLAVYGTTRTLLPAEATAPVLFAPDVPAEKQHEISVRLRLASGGDDALLSAPLPLGVIGAKGTARVPDPAAASRHLVFGYSTGFSGGSQGHRTRVVAITPRWAVYNGTDHDVVMTTPAGPVRLPAGEVVSYHGESAAAPHSVVHPVVFTKDKAAARAEPSCPIDIAAVGEVTFKLNWVPPAAPSTRRRVESPGDCAAPPDPPAVAAASGEQYTCYVRCSVKEEESCAYVSLAETAPPFEVANRLPVDVEVWQTGFERGKVRVPACASRPFGWEDGGAGEPTLQVRVVPDAAPARATSLPLEVYTLTGAPVLTGLDGIVAGGNVYMSLAATAQAQRFELAVFDSPALEADAVRVEDPVTDGGTALNVKVDVARVSVALVRQEDPREAAVVSLDGVSLSYSRAGAQEMIQARLEALQIDDMSDQTPLFPVPVFTVRDEGEEGAAAAPFAALCVVRNLTPSDLTHFETVSLAFGAVSVSIGDRFLWEVFQWTREVAGALQEAPVAGLPDTPAAVIERCCAPPSPLAGRIQYDHLFIDTVALTITVDRQVDGNDPYRDGLGLGLFSLALPSVKDGVVTLRKMEIAAGRESVFMVLRRLAVYYARELEATHNVGGIVGRIQFLGNPLGLLSNVTAGVRDFVVYPAKGLTESPVGFGVGILRGTGSLLGKSVGGVMGTVAGVARGSARAFESVADKRWRQQRAVKTKSANILEPAVKGVFDGVVGLVKEPVIGAMEGGVVGGVMGTGRGILGVVAKPACGVLNTVSDVASLLERVVLLKTSIARVRKPRFFDPNRPSQSATAGHHEAYENQRWYMGVGWSERLVPLADAPHWSDAQGKKSPPRDAILPPAGHAWDGPWVVDAAHGGADGWLYATDFDLGIFHTYRHELDFVRRRRWVRASRPVTELQQPPTQDVEALEPKGAMYQSPFIALEQRVARQLATILAKCRTAAASQRLHDATCTVETTENQKYAPGVGWTRQLGPMDCWRWSDRAGREKRLPRDLVQPPPHCVWASEWENDGGDANGWFYADHCDGVYAPSLASTSTFRRRHWVRTARMGSFLTGV